MTKICAMNEVFDHVGRHENKRDHNEERLKFSRFFFAFHMNQACKEQLH